MNNLSKIFIELVLSGEIIDLLNKHPLPNLPLKTMGGEVFWTNIASCNGWRLQRNTVFGNCRILNPDDIRRAWGSLEAMKKLFEDFEK